MSGKRKEREYRTDFSRRPAPDAPSASSASSAPAAAGASRGVLLQTAHLRADGTVTEGVKFVSARAPEAATQPAGLYAESEIDARSAAATTAAAQIFDLYEQQEAEVEAPLGEEDAPRDLRDSDFPLREWVQESRGDFLVELLRWEGRGDHREYMVCPRCAKGNAQLRCKTCLTGGEMMCQACVVEMHRQDPFHRIESWTGVYFAKTTLKKQGLRIQLGHWHQQDRCCPLPVPAPANDFVIVDGSGVHEVALDFCGCGSGGLHTTQLLRAGLYPATSQAPRTAATFAVLRRFHLLSFESKASAYEFFHSLARETDNTGLFPARDRYHEFLRMTRQWRNLQMLKRAGRGHAASGIAGTAPGECALLCPACPQPGKNLPPDWKEAPEEKQFLHALFLAMDANFRLKRKDVSTEEADPGLGPGWAFFCEVRTYMEHLAEHWNDKQERSTCVAHDAVDKPDRESRGTAASGIGAIDCARHNMKRPNAVGDLQLGERYINMDYMFFLSLVDTELVRFCVSYDIACQWHKNIWKRMKTYKREIHFRGDERYMSFLVPKFHLPAHIEECNLQFSFNLRPNVGQTDGEAPERGWADANPLATSTKEMGPGARRDALDDHWNDWNHKKGIGLGRLILRKVEDAVPMMEEMQGAFAHMEASLTPEAIGQDVGPVPEWTEMAAAWEKDWKQPNPFETLRKDQHLAKVRQELAEEAAARQAAGREDPGTVRDDMHVTEVIAMGLQLEEQQRVLRFDMRATGLHPTPDQRTAMVERSSKLRRKIEAWIEIQRGFFPFIDRLRQLQDAARARTARSQPIAGVQVYDMALWMPSAVMKQAGGARDLGPLHRDCCMHEYRLRVGQANEALHEIRRQLLVRSHLYQQKDAYSRGVRENMRSGSKIELCDDRIRRMVAQYRVARLALVVLGRVVDRHEWEVTLKPLLDGDVRGMPHAQFGDPVRQRGGQATRKYKKGKRRYRRRNKRAKIIKPPPTLSWIWIAQVKEADPGSSQAMNEAVRIEWAKARARAMRWTEEVDLLEEEMARIKRFLTWRSEWWEGRVGQRGLVEGPQLEGETAYAMRQAHVQAELRVRFEEMWKDIAELISEGRAAVVAERAAAFASVRAHAAELAQGGDDGGDAEGDGDDSEDQESDGEADDSGEEDEEDEEEIDEGSLPVPASALKAVPAVYTDL